MLAKTALDAWISFLVLVSSTWLLPLASSSGEEMDRAMLALGATIWTAGTPNLLVNSIIPAWTVVVSNNWSGTTLGTLGFSGLKLSWSRMRFLSAGPQVL